jgi:hypothetical protein
VVLVESSDNSVQKLPPVIRDAFQAITPNSIPKVVLADPALTKVYASYSYTQLKGQEYRTIFRDGKKAHREDLAAGKVAKPGSAPAVAGGAATAPGEAPAVVDSNGTRPMETWTNKQGREIRAALVEKQADGKFLFKLADGRTAAVDPATLADESVARAEEQLGAR